MANEKSNNVRILQSTKKTSLSPLITAVIGFLAGVSVISIAVFIFMNLQMNEAKKVDGLTTHAPAVQQELNTHHTAEQSTTATSTHTNVDITELNTQSQHAQLTHTLSDEDNTQAYESDLGNAFKHPTTKPQKLASEKPTNTAQDPFALTQAQPKNPVINNTQALKPVATPLATKPLQAQTKVAIVTPVVKATKPAVSEEPEPESPRGSLQVTVTKTLTPIKETPKEPKSES